MKKLLILIALFSMFQALNVSAADSSSDLKECIEQAMADESGYEVDESEATDFCMKAE